MRSTFIGVLATSLAGLLCLAVLPAAGGQLVHAATPAHQAVTPAADGYVPVGPTRVLDTRPNASLHQNQYVTLSVAGRAGVPSNAKAVALSVTGTNPTASTFVTVWPTGATRPTASNLNLLRGQTAPNSVVVAPGTGGDVNLYNHEGTTDLTVDIVGYFPAGSAIVTGTPRRLMDTRGGSDTTFDGQASGGGPVGSGDTHVRNLAVDGRAFTGVPAGSTAILNVTGTDPTADTFLTVWPTGVTRPTASSINLVPRQTSPNMVMVGVGAGGRVSFFNHLGSTDVVVDLLAVIPSGSGVSSVRPARLLDTRSGYPTVDGRSQGTGAFGSQVVRSLKVTGRGGVPATGVSAVAVNITGISPTTATYITAYPSGPHPVASNLNLARGELRAVFAFVGVAADGTIKLYNNAGSTDLAVDVLGYVTAGSGGVTPVGANGFEGCTNGQVVTPANSANGGNKFDTVDTGIGAPQYSTAQAAHGTCSVTLTGSVGTAGSYATWDNATSTSNTVFARAYIYLKSLPAGDNGTVRFLRFSEAGQIGGYVAVNDLSPGPQGTVALEDGGTNHLGLSDTVLRVDTWYRIEVAYDNTNLTMTGRIYLMDSTSPLEQWTVGAGAHTSQPITDVGVGQQYDEPTDYNRGFFIDDVAYGTSWLGPAQ
ncbi:MAG: hypothetical protein ACRDRL_05995 [Sciscionella sp.]